MTTYTPAYYRDLLQSIQQLHENIDQLPQWFRHAWETNNIESRILWNPVNNGPQIVEYYCRWELTHPWLNACSIRFIIEKKRSNQQEFIVRVEWPVFYFYKTNSPGWHQYFESPSFMKDVRTQLRQITGLPVKRAKINSSFRSRDKITIEVPSQWKNALESQLQPAAETLFNWVENT